MTVKSSSTGTKILTVLDGVARHQPIGVSELARLIDLDKSTVQRMLVTLEKEGWITADSDGNTKWRATDRIQLLADIAFGGRSLKSRARASLESIRDQTTETVFLATRDGSRFRIVDVAESEHMLRVVPGIGRHVFGPVSATSLACTPYLSQEAGAQLLGNEINKEVEKEITLASKTRYAKWKNPYAGGTISIASAIRDSEGTPIGTIVLTAPEHRLSATDIKIAGTLLREAADSLSGR